MIKIGVTGSIASGKTTVARMLSRRKYPLFDADREVAKIYKKKTYFLNALGLIHFQSSAAVQLISPLLF